jgi:hypothetical protein
MFEAKFVEKLTEYSLKKGKLKFDRLKFEIGHSDVRSLILKNPSPTRPLLISDLWICSFKISYHNLGKSEARLKFRKSLKFIAKDSFQSHNFNNNETNLDVRLERFCLYPLC